MEACEHCNFIFTSPDDSTSSQRSAVLGGDGALAFVAVALEVDDHPIANTTKLVGTVGVREQRGEMPAVFVAVKDRKPGGAIRVVSSGCDSRELARFGFLSICSIDLE
jgi:hypothetical protein